MNKIYDDYRETQKNITFIDKIIRHFSLERKILRAVHNYSDKGIKERKKVCRLLKKAQIDLYPETLIGNNLYLPHPHNITIGFGTEIGDNVTIYPGAIIIGDIKIGDNSVIRAGSIVLKSCENGSILAGNPAKVIGDVYEKK